MYGWKQVKQGFEEIIKRDVRQNDMPLSAPIISPKYFPGTEIDYIRLCNADTLEDLDILEAPALLALAVKVGGVRLIDNMLLGFAQK